ncbi:oxidoreductase [Virgisporangium aliadipatigenens]|uniref:Oxidoreductase n=1 Tax=Virgisporangium aliadipatigenens TaxID=741659 RepID=A0A8J4DSK0_9ACTN|nr:aldo/keto reductase [Virgisporangium aliadipatigenens]GIJ48251.1 oxidoreductase [Virgisporangium aliadipatigenens]
MRTVNRIGLGALRLVLGRAVPTPDEAVTLLREAVSLGVDHIDTFAAYPGAHELIRRALAPYPDDLVITTKTLLQTPAADFAGQVKEDLRRLGRDALDLVYLRAGTVTSAPGGEPVGERFAALVALQREGLIREIGLSNVDAAQLAEAQAIAPVAAVQNRFHIHDTADRAMVDHCGRSGIAYVPFFPLGGGPVPLRRDRLAPVAARLGVTVEQVALAWLIAVSPTTLPIPGTGSLEHLRSNVMAGAIRLPAEELAALSTVD